MYNLEHLLYHPALVFGACHNSLLVAPEVVHVSVVLHVCTTAGLYSILKNSYPDNYDLGKPDKIVNHFFLFCC